MPAGVAEVAGDEGEAVAGGIEGGALEGRGERFGAAAREAVDAEADDQEDAAHFAGVEEVAHVGAGLHAEAID